ncbi:hypothetical protein BGZ65_008530, partial [Modicella reniformis]
VAERPYHLDKINKYVVASPSDPLRQRKRETLEQQPKPVYSTEDDDEPKEAVTAVFTPTEQKLSLAVLAVLTVVAFSSRFYKINEPDEVVFDEVHFGKFASYYIRRTYFFDVHPPLAKMMLAAMGYFIGYDGHFLFDNIGDNYITNNVPYIGLRALPAFLGAMTVPIVYMTMREAGFPIVTCALAAFFITFEALIGIDNMLVTQTRLILLDSMLVFFMVCSIYSYVRFHKARNKPNLYLKSVFTNTVTSLYEQSILDTVVVLVACYRGIHCSDHQEFLNHFWARAFSLILIPAIIYLFWFWVHFAVLTRSGPGDDFMSTEFQETLHGNTMADGLCE